MLVRAGVDPIDCRSSLSHVLTEAEINNELESVEGVNTMEYMVENLMKKIDENKEKHAEFNLNPTVGTPTVDINSTPKPAPSQTNCISDSQSGNQKYKNSLTENIEKLKKVC